MDPANPEPYLCYMQSHACKLAIALFTRSAFRQQDLDLLRLLLHLKQPRKMPRRCGKLREARLPGDSLSVKGILSGVLCGLLGGLLFELGSRSQSFLAASF